MGRSLSRPPQLPTRRGDRADAMVTRDDVHVDLPTRGARRESQRCAHARAVPAVPPRRVLQSRHGDHDQHRPDGGRRASRSGSEGGAGLVGAARRSRRARCRRRDPAARLRHRQPRDSGRSRWPRHVDRGGDSQTAGEPTRSRQHATRGLPHRRRTALFCRAGGIRGRARGRIRSSVLPAAKPACGQPRDPARTPVDRRDIRPSRPDAGVDRPRRLTRRCPAAGSTWRRHHESGRRRRHWARRHWAGKSRIR